MGLIEGILAIILCVCLLGWLVTDVKKSIRPTLEPTRLQILEGAYMDGNIETDEFERRAGTLMEEGKENEPAGFTPAPRGHGGGLVEI